MFEVPLSTKRPGLSYIPIHVGLSVFPNLVCSRFNCVQLHEDSTGSKGG